MPQQPDFTELVQTLRSFTYDGTNLAICVLNADFREVAFFENEATDETIQLARDLAYTALVAGRDTEDFVTYQQNWSGDDAWKNWLESTPLVAVPTEAQFHDPRFVPLSGGTPIYAGSTIVGGLSVVNDGVGWTDIIQRIGAVTYQVNRVHTERPLEHLVSA